MIVTGEKAILMIEPRYDIGTQPVIDELTRKMTAAWRNRVDSSYGFRGFHTCSCHATSDNKEHWIGGEGGPLTNSLCIHYLVYHRPYVPAGELAKVAALTYGEAEPTREELRPPR